MNTATLKRELNPVHDLDRLVVLYDKIHTVNNNPLKTIANNYAELLGEYCISMFKCTLRTGVAGSIIGSAAGSISAIVNGGDMTHDTLLGLKIGMIYGMTFDYLQYHMRALYHISTEIMKRTL